MRRRVRVCDVICSTRAFVVRHSCMRKAYLSVAHVRRQSDRCKCPRKTVKFCAASNFFSKRWLYTTQVSAMLWFNPRLMAVLGSCHFSCYVIVTNSVLASRADSSEAWFCTSIVRILPSLCFRARRQDARLRSNVRLYI